MVKGVTTSKRKKRHPVKAWLTVLVGILIFTVVCIVLLPRSKMTADNINVEKPTAKIETDKGDVVASSVETKDASTATTLTTASDSSLEGDNSVQMDTPQDIEETPTELRRRAGARVLDKDGNDVFKPRPELKTRTDKFLFSVLRRPFGGGKVNLNIYKLEEDFKKSLEAPIEILETDTEDEKAIKMEVEGYKQELAKRVEAGESIVELLDDIRHEVNLAATEHAEARRKLYELIKKGEFDAAEIYITAINKRFAEEGILQLHIPDKLLKKAVAEHGEEYLRREQMLEEAETQLEKTQDTQ